MGTELEPILNMDWPAKPDFNYLSGYSYTVNESDRAMILDCAEKADKKIQSLQAQLKDKTKDEIQALIEEYGDPNYKTSEFALYNLISVAQQLCDQLEAERWIPVEERLPDKADRYETCFQNTIHDDGCVDVLALDEVGIVHLSHYFPKLDSWNISTSATIIKWKPINLPEKAI